MKRQFSRSGDLTLEFAEPSGPRPARQPRMFRTRDQRVEVKRARTVSRERKSPDYDRDGPLATSIERAALLPAVYPQKGKLQYFKELEETKAAVHAAEELNRQLKTKILAQLVIEVQLGRPEEVQGMLAGT